MRQSLVLVPTYNEERSIECLLSRLLALGNVDILVIDDSSPDGTGDAVEALGERYPQVSLLRREAKEGLGRAYVAGFREALRRGYERIVTMDADLSHAPEDVPRLLDALDGADVSIGSRYVRGGAATGWPLRRRLLSRLGGAYARLLLRVPARDVTSGFRAYRRSALQTLDWERDVRSSGFIFQVELLCRLLDRPGARVAEVPILFRNRTQGSSKISAAVVMEGVLAVAALALCARRRRRPGSDCRQRQGQRQRQRKAENATPVTKGESHA